MNKWQYITFWLILMGGFLIIGVGIWWEVHRVGLAVLEWLKAHK